MKELERVDKNFAVQAGDDYTGTVWYDSLKPPFSLHGLMYEDGAFRRMPEKVAASVSPAVLELHTRCSGGRLRFRTDSPYLAIHAQMGQIGPVPHVSLTGLAGFDLYVGQQHVKPFIPPMDIQDSYMGKLPLPGGMQEITLYFPLYAGVRELEIGLAEGSRLEPASAYPDPKPIVFYGSSITQGAAASRAGMCYTNRVCRELNRDIWNLGFSGSARGEPAIAEYIAGLPMTCFVCDYDHNASTLQDLERTHWPLYRAVRQANPDLPIVFMCRPRFVVNDFTQQRIDLIRSNYEKAKAEGDRNVYLLTGPELMELARYDGTVDGVHPNDLGFYSMAQTVIPLLERILK